MDEHGNVKEGVEGGKPLALRGVEERGRWERALNGNNEDEDENEDEEDDDEDSGEGDRGKKGEEKEKEKIVVGAWGGDDDVD